MLAEERMESGSNWWEGIVGTQFGPDNRIECSGAGLETDSADNIQWEFEKVP